MTVFPRNLKNLIQIILLVSLANLSTALPTFSQRKTTLENNCFIKTSSGRIITLPNCGSQPQQIRPQSPQTKPETIQAKPAASQTRPVLQRLSNEPLLYTDNGQVRLWDFVEGISSSRNLLISGDKYSSTSYKFRLEYPLSADIRNVITNGSIDCKANQINLSGSSRAYNPANQPVQSDISINEFVPVSPVSIQKYCDNPTVLLEKKK